MPGTLSFHNYHGEQPMKTADHQRVHVQQQDTIVCMDAAQDQLHHYEEEDELDEDDFFADHDSARPIIEEVFM